MEFRVYHKDPISAIVFGGQLYQMISLGQEKQLHLDDLCQCL